MPTKEFTCRTCEVSEFIHTADGIVCSGCNQPAHILTYVDPIVPFGLTRQLEELDRMAAL